MTSISPTSAKLKVAVLLVFAGAASAGAGILLWYQADLATSRVLSIFVGAIAVVTVFKAGRILGRNSGAFHVCGAILAVLLVVWFVIAPQRTDRGSSWNEAVQAARLLRAIVQKNQEYAREHGGSFAYRLSQLTSNAVVGNSYTIVYSPIVDLDHVVRHYSIQAVPLGTYRFRLYADETGVIRRSETGPADKNSPALQR
jgi:hypothetical protein